MLAIPKYYSGAPHGITPQRQHPRNVLEIWVCGIPVIAGKNWVVSDIVVSAHEYRNAARKVEGAESVAEVFDLGMGAQFSSA
jgi:hypothetical protein